MLKPIWLYLTKSDIETERLQCQQEGRDITHLEEEFAHVLALDLEDLANQPAAQQLLDKTQLAPLRPDFPFQEPSGLEAIRSARPSQGPALPELKLSDAELLDKLHGAWVGRSVGCLLGKPVEGWRRPKMWGYLKDLGLWPLSDFFSYNVPADIRQKYHLSEHSPFADLVNAMPEDDDLNYTTAAMAILKRYGPHFTPEQVAEFWMSDIPILHTCTAERVAYRNFCNLLSPPASASFRNPYREWIGAQIRADFWGYAAPGDPQRAAEWAWRDACISHVKNGVYGAMWVAAMTAAAFVTNDIPTILRAGLGQIPQNCRLADAIERLFEWQEVGVDYDTAVYRVHEFWDENRSHDWCHTISNAMVVAVALLWGEGDYAKTICRAVQACFDTDCNGATTGSILGILHGRKNLPAAWVDGIADTLHTGVTGYHTVKLADMAAETMRLIEKIR